MLARFLLSSLDWYARHGKSIQDLVADFAARWKVSPNVLIAGIQEVVRRTQADPQAAFSRFINFRDLTTELANQYSRQAFDHFLRLYPDRTNILLLTGGAHRSIYDVPVDPADQATDT